MNELDVFRRSKLPYLILTQNEYASLQAGSTIELDSETLHHLRKVLRLKGSLKCYISDGRGSLASAQLTEGNTLAPLAEIFATKLNDGVKVHIITVPIKKANMGFLLQKATELGIAKITLIKSDYQQHQTEKIARMNATVKNAAMQSRNLYLPQIEISQASVLDFCYDENTFWGSVDGDVGLKLDVKIETICFVNGPEGGFSPREEEFLKNNFRAVRLSYNVLRSETAVLAFAQSVSTLTS